MEIQNQSRVRSFFRAIKTTLADYWKENTMFVMVAGTIGLLIAFYVLIVWFFASSITSVPKGEQHEANANTAIERSISHEANANTHRDTADRKESEKREVEVELELLRREKEIRRQTKAELERKYEELRKKSVVVSDSALDVRERELLARLRRLQSGQ